MIEGRASAEGTARYAARHASAHASHWRRCIGLTCSSLGLGSYLGSEDASDDATYAAAVRRAVESGINVIDSAINYRYQQSERAIGAGLKQAIAEGRVARDEIF